MLPGRYPLAAPGQRESAQATLCSADCSCCFSKTRTISSTGSSLVSGRNFHTNTMASAHSPAKMTIPQQNPRRRVQVVATVSVRYIVYDVDAAIDFYCRNLGFTEV